MTVGDIQDALAIDGMQFTAGAVRAALNRQNRTFTQVGTKSTQGGGRPEILWGVISTNDHP